METEKIVRKELNKLGIDYEDLKESTKTKLLDAENAMEKTSKYNANYLNKFAKHDYKVSVICDKINVKRQNLYAIYPEVATYINSRANYYIEKDMNAAKVFNENTNEDELTIKQLIQRDAEYMELKELVKQQQKTIKSLTSEKNTLAKQLANALNSKNQTSVVQNKYNFQNGNSSNYS